jgi:CHAT domain-containing protein
MDKDQAGIHVSALADEVLTAPGHRARRRLVFACEQAELIPLAEELTRRAQEQTRQTPREAAGWALLAYGAGRRLQEVEVQIAALRAASEAFAVLGRFAAALRTVDTAVSLAFYRNDTAQLAALSLLKLEPLIHLQRCEERRSVGFLLLHAMKTAGDVRGVIRTRMALADRHIRLDEPREALHEYREIESLLPDGVGPRFRAVLATNRANALVSAHRFRAAQRHFEIARGLFADQECEHASAQVSCNESFGHVQAGRYDAALSGYAAVAEVFERQTDERHIALIDLERAEVHLQLNLPAKASRLALRAEERFIDLGMWKERAQSALHAGQALVLLGEEAKAREAFTRAEAQFDALGLCARRASCRLQRARLELQCGRLEDARKDIETAEAVSGRTSTPFLPSAIDLLHAGLALAEGLPEAAVEALARVSAVWRRIRAPWIRIEALHLRARALTALGEVGPAVEAYRNAIEELEDYRAGVPPDEYMTSFLAGRVQLYDEVVDLLVQLGDKESAFEFTERAKSRALVGLLNSDLGDGTRPIAQSIAEERIELLRRRLGALYRGMIRSGSPDPQRYAGAMRETGRIEAALAERLRETRTRPAVQPAAPIDLACLRESLPADVTLLEYLVTDDALFTFVVTQDEIEVVRQTIAVGELQRHLDRFGFHIARFNRTGVEAEEFHLHATRVNLDALTELLLEPVAEHLRTRKLLVVPHGVLHGLPFHALTWDDGWVADSFDVIHAPSAAVYHLCGRQRPPASGSACVIGLPDEAAPEAEREIGETAAALRDARCWLGEQATLARLRESAVNAPLLHIATHGLFRHEHPMLSSIRLADRWVNLHDIYQLRLDAELVVLSACESGAARVTEGDQVLGLMRGFLVQGARALLASQWRVSDATTADFMRVFYRALAEDGNPVAAHGAAMKTIRRQHPHPYYWAPFLLSGRPGPLRRLATPPTRPAHDCGMSYANETGVS